MPLSNRDVVSEIRSNSRSLYLPFGVTTHFYLFILNIIKQLIMKSSEAIKVDEIKRGEMINILNGQAKDGKKKSMEIENGKIYVYHNQNPRGIFFMVRDAVKRYNQL